MCEYDSCLSCKFSERFVSCVFLHNEVKDVCVCDKVLVCKNRMKTCEKCHEALS